MLEHAQAQSVGFARASEYVMIPIYLRSLQSLELALCLGQFVALVAFHGGLTW